MDMVKKNQEQEEHGVHSSLVLNSKQAGQVASAGIILLFLAFISGYYWGKHSSISEFKDAFDQEVVADKIYYSLALHTYNQDE